MTTTLKAAVAYIGPEWSLSMSSADDPGGYRPIGTALDGRLRIERGAYGFRSREDAEAAAIRVAADEGAAAVEFFDVTHHDGSRPPYRTVGL